jgi:hypothetical protein
MFCSWEFCSWDVMLSDVLYVERFVLDALKVYRRRYVVFPSKIMSLPASLLVPYKVQRYENNMYCSTEDSWGKATVCTASPVPGYGAGTPYTVHSEWGTLRDYCRGGNPPICRLYLRQ